MRQQPAGRCLPQVFTMAVAAWGRALHGMWRRRRHPALVLAAAAVLCSAAAAQIRYYYDEQGRLVEAVAPDGNSLQYSYDLNGNILSIRRRGVSVLSLNEFTPNQGPTGTVVQLYGSGFSPVAADNTVKFNGKNATVSAATATQLTVKVPSSATTGKIRVTNANGNVLSATDFVVDAEAAAPTLSGFTPQLGAVGTPVTLTGTHFQVDPDRDRVSFGPVRAPVTGTPTTTQLTAQVPKGMPSGKISIATPYGTATSTNDFYVLPPGTFEADIAYTGRLALNGAPITVSVPAGKRGLVLFDALAGDYLSTVVKNTATTPNFIVWLYGPDGALVINQAFQLGWKGVWDINVRAMQTGTYTMLLTPSGSLTSTVEFGMVSHLRGELTVDAPAPTALSFQMGQDGRYTFGGQAGRGLHMLVTGNTIGDDSSQSNQATVVTVYEEAGQYVNSVGQLERPGRGAVLALPNLPSSGLYKTHVVLSDMIAGDLKLQLITAGSGAGFAVEGATPLDIPALGIGYLSFRVDNAGIGYQLQANPVTLTQGTAPALVDVQVYSPDGSYVGTPCSLGPTPLEIPLMCDMPPNLFMTAGTYSLAFIPVSSNAAKLSVKLTPDLSLRIDGTPAPVSITRPGQRVNFGFPGVAGQNLHLLLTGNTLDDGNAATVTNTTVYVYTPSGAQFAVVSLPGNAPAGVVLPLQLPTTGTYRISVVPASSDTGALTLKLVAANSGPLLLTNGTALAVTVPARDLGYYSFDAVAGRGYSVDAGSLGFTPSTGNPSMAVTVYRPDGSAVPTPCTLTSAVPICDLPPSLFAATGRYGLVLVPSAIYAANAGLRLWSDASGTLTVDAASATTVALQPAQNARYAFDATAGQNLQLLISDNTLDDGNAGTNNATNFTVYRPDGNAVTGTTQLTSSRKGEVLPLVNLPQTGTYQVSVSPGGLDTGSVKLQLRSANSGTLLMADGSPVPVSVAAYTPGYYSLDAQAGSGYSLQFADLAFAPSGGFPIVSVQLYRPDGSLAAAGCSVTPTTPICDLAPSSFTATGRYGLVFSVSAPQSASFNLRLWSDAAGSLTVDAPAPTLVSLQPAQNARYSFTASAGQSLQLLISDNQLDDGNGGTTNNTNITVYRPDGVPAWATIQNTPNRKGEVLPLTNLPQTGTYRVEVSPGGMDAGTLRLHLRSLNAGDTIDSGTPTAMNVDALGLAYRSFVPEAGRGYTLKFTNLVFNPGTTPSMGVVMYRASDGAIAKTCFVSPTAPTCDLDPSLIAAGRHGLSFAPLLPNAASYTVELVPDVMGGALAVDAVSPTIAVLQPAQNAHYTFNGTLGQRLHLLVSGNTLDDGDGSTNNIAAFNVHRPDGVLHATVGSQASNDRRGDVFLVPPLPATGSFRLSVLSGGRDAGQAAVQLRSENSGDLVATDGSSVAVSVPAQDLAYRSFMADAGRSYRIALTGLAITPGSANAVVNVWLTRPAAPLAQVCALTIGNPVCDIPASWFTASGRHGLSFSPGFPNAASFQLQLTLKP